MHAFQQHVTQTRTRGGARKAEKRVKQTELVFRTWGGARNGAGRKPKGDRPLVPHVARPDHKVDHPVLVTTRLREGLRSLRHPAEAARIRAALVSALAASEADCEGGAVTAGSAPFQVVHHSIQSNHLHLIVEAADRRALSGGMRALLVRIARALNRLWGRTGAVFADRFHERVLSSPRQVRNALVYVLQNLRKHGICLAGPDPYSSAPEFDGWRTAEQLRGGGTARERGHLRGDPAGAGGSGSSGPAGLQRAARVTIPSPKTWLLGVGWQRHGLIDPCESPRAH
jgi:REP element-mobilizing transposase RayT